ncbi:MMPL family transporter [candidate division KSB1 bacterium]|nr:MMPL family transporter [candidate division KSB1 bacterium]
MNITKIAVRRGVTFIMIYLIAVGFGLFSLSRLNIDLYPELEFPMMAVITQYTGVGPFDMETVVTRPLEETVASVENIETVSSSSSQGLSVVFLEFSWGTDMNQAEIDVRNNIDFIRDMLPDDITEPLIFAFDPSQQPILFLTVNSEIHGLAELRHISEHDAEPRIERIPGVASAFTSGGLQREIRILLDPVKLKAHNLSVQQVSSALQMNNLQIPSGWIENNMQEFTIQTAGEYVSVDQIAQTSVASMNGSVIRIKDVAEVLDGFKEQRQRVWSDGKPAVMLMVQKQSDANTVNVAQNVVGQLDRIQSELPKGVELAVFWDQSQFITRSMSNLGLTAIQAVFLAFLVLLFFLHNLRSSLIVAVSIPVSMVVTFAVMDQAGLTLNIISMAGLALAVGMLVDNSIVVLESIYRYREQGENARDAANKGSNEVAMAITASTLTTLSVFVPVLFVPGLAGEMFNDMVVTICFSLTVSLVVALTLIPLLSSRLLKVEKKTVSSWTTRLSDRVSNWLTGLENFYSKNLNWSLNHRRLLFLGTLIIFVGSIFLLAAQGGDFLPNNDNGFLEIRVARAPGTSLDEMEKTIRKMNQIVREKAPESEIVYSNFGQGEGIFALFSTQSSAEGEVSIRFSKLTERDRTIFEIEDVLREEFNKIPGAEITFSSGGMGAMFGGGDIIVKIFGHDLDVSRTLAQEIEDKARSIEGVIHAEVDMRKPRPELQINLDRQKIADLGLSTAQVGNVVSTSILGTVVTRYREGGDEFDVRVQLAKDARQNKSDLENIMVMTPRGRQVPLRAIATVEYSQAPQEIGREDQERVVSVNINIANRDLAGVTRDVQNMLKTVPLPPDFRVEIGGQAEEQQESFKFLGYALLVAIVLTYMVMASQFESFLDPFIILITIPLSLIGVALGLFITGTTLSVMALIGMVMLVGIVVNNGIVLVDYINQLRERGYELFDAIKQGGVVRMRPVLMTALTTILAMLPLALGLGESGEAWAPMARAVMGGMTVATILTLVVVPSLYASFELIGEKIKAKREDRKARRLAKAYK